MAKKLLPCGRPSQPPAGQESLLVCKGRRPQFTFERVNQRRRTYLPHSRLALSRPAWNAFREPSRLPAAKAHTQITMLRPITIATSIDFPPSVPKVPGLAETALGLL